MSAFGNQKNTAQLDSRGSNRGSKSEQRKIQVGLKVPAMGNSQNERDEPQIQPNKPSDVRNVQSKGSHFKRSGVNISPRDNPKFQVQSPVMNSDMSTKEYEHSKKTTITPGREDSLGSREYSGKLNQESKREKKFIKVNSKEELMNQD